MRFLSVIIPNSISDFQGRRMEEKLGFKDFYKTFSVENGRKVAKLFEEGTKGSYCMLRIIRDGAGKITPADVARAMDISTARVAVAMKSLDKKGYIDKKPCESDGRKITVEITPAGRTALEKREVLIRDVLKDVFGKLTREEAETLFKLLRKAFS